MNWAFSKPCPSDIYVPTLETQIPNIPETSSYAERNSIETTLIEGIASTNEVMSALEEMGSLPSSSKQSIETKEISNACPHN